MTEEGKLYSSLAFPGRLETEAVGAGNPGVWVAGGPRPGSRALWEQKGTDILAFIFAHIRSVRLVMVSVHNMDMAVFHS